MAYTPIYTPKNFTDWGPPDLDASNLNDIEAALVSLENGLQTAAADTDTNTAAITTINGEISDLNNLIDEILPDDSASGNPAVITDAFAGECKSLVLTLEPIQSGSGTPSPANPRPITGRTQSVVTRTGKNVFNKNATDKTQNSFLDSATGSETPSVNWSISGYIKTEESLSYALSGMNNLSTSNYSLGFYDKNKTYIRGVASQNMLFTIPSGEGIVFFKFDYKNADENTIQLEINSTPTNYAPYDAESITEAYGQTLYGASVDVTAGDAKNKWGYIEFDGSNDENWAKFESGSASAFAMIISVPNGETNTVNDSNIKCDKLASISTSATWGSFDLWVSLYVSSIVVGVQSVTTVSDLRTWLSNNPLHIVYKYATPADIPLTSQNLTLLKGDNVITTDADNVDVEYKADIALYIAKQLGGNLGNRGAKSAPAEEPADDPKEEEKTDEKIIEPVTKEAKK